MKTLSQVLVVVHFLHPRNKAVCAGGLLFYLQLLQLTLQP